MKELRIVRLVLVLALPLLCALGGTEGNPDAQSDSNWTTKYTMHVVRKGETIRSIGMAYGVSLSELRTANSLEGNAEPNIGDNIRVPFGVYAGPGGTNQVESFKCGTPSLGFGCCMLGQ
jgi:hypothetical protein